MMISTIKKVQKILTKEHKSKYYLLIFLIIVGMLLEILGIGLIIPFLENITKNNSSSFTFFNPILLSLGIENKNQSIIFFASVLFLVFLIKTIFMIFLTYRQNIFLQNLNAYVTIKLYSNYLSQNYNFFIRRNSSDLNKNLFTDTSYFNVFCNALTTIITESAFLVAIVSTVIYLEPIGSIFAFVTLIIITRTYYYFSKSKLINWSKSRKDIEKRISKIALESLKGHKELLIFQKKDFFKAQFENYKTSLSKIQSKFNTLNTIPRYIIEFISIIVLICFLFFLILVEKDLIQFIPILGVFVAAIFKLTPSINKLINSFQNLKFYNSSVDVILNELNLKNSSSKRSSKKRNEIIDYIIIKNLKFSYSGVQENILDGVNLKLVKGEILIITGESGQGKSTFLDLLVGLHKPFSGKILINGKESIFNDLFNWRRKLGYVTQSMFLLDSSISENIAFGVKPKEIDEKAVKRAIKQAQLDDYIYNLKDAERTIIGESGVKMSGGQKQRLAIARALYHDPSILIFDEATSNLDKKTEKEILGTIHKLKQNKIIIVVAHKDSALKKSDKILNLDSGRFNIIK